MKKTISREVANDCITALNLKMNHLEDGTELTFEEVQDGNDLPNGKPNPQLIYMSSKMGRVKIPVREYFRFEGAGGHNFSDLGDADEIEFADQIKIESSEPRKGRDGEVAFPIFAYKGVDKLLDSNVKYDYNDLLKEGLKENHGMEPVQNYTVAIV